MQIRKLDPNIALSVLAIAILLVLTIAYWRTPAPQVHIEYGESAIGVYADKAWTLLPGDCVQIHWEVDGSQSVHIEGVERREAGSEKFCPAIQSSNPRIELTDHLNDFYQSYQLEIHHLPDFVINLVAVAGLAFFGAVALYYLWRNDPSHRPSFRTLLLALLAIALCISLLRLSGLYVTIEGVLATLRNIFTHFRWQLLGALLAGGLYVSLAMRMVWESLKYRKYSDILVVASFLLIVLLLYLPFGFNTIGHWEEWHGRAYLEGGLWAQQSYGSELSSRFWLFLLHMLAWLIESESFLGFNVIYALLLFGTVVSFYGILRQFHV